MKEGNSSLITDCPNCGHKELLIREKDENILYEEYYECEECKSTFTFLDLEDFM